MIYKGNVKQKDIYIGSTKIGKVYKGSTLVYQSKLPAGQVIFESSTPGTYTINIPNSQNYYIQLVGGGGGASAFSSVDHYGGSGGYVYGEVSISEGTYSITIGSGGSETYPGTDSSFIGQLAGGGKSVIGHWEGGTCTTTLNYTNGQSGYDGGASVYGGYGQGGTPRVGQRTGGNGYAKIITA